MSRIISLFFLLFCFHAVYADSPAELLKELDTTTSDRRKIILLNQICKYYWEVDPNLSISYGEKAIALASKTNEKSLLGAALNYTSIGHFWINDLPNATYYAYKALAIREALSDSTGLITNHNTIGNIFLRQKKYEEALISYKKALELGYRLKRQQSITSALSNIGEVYDLQGKPEKALPIYLEVYELDKGTGNKRNIALDILFIGKTYCKLGKTEVGVRYLEQAHALSLDLKNAINKVYILRHLAQAYLQIGDLKKAQLLSEACLAGALKLKSGDNVEEATYVLSQIYQSRGDYKTALTYLDLHNQYQDSLQNYQQMKYFAEMHSKYESDKKEAENQQLRVESDLQKEMLAQKSKQQYTMGAFFLMLLVLAFVLFKGRRRDKANNVRLSEYNKLILQKNEDIQEQKDELVKLNHQKDLLFSIIAHDLRSPLISLQSLLQLLNMGTLPQEKLDRFIKDLNTQQQNTLSLLDNLLAWAKVQMEGVKLEAKPFQISTLVQVNLELLRPQASKKGVELLNHVSPQHWALVDEETIKLVFRNLLSNAIKYSHTGTQVEITAEPLEQGQLLITVQDSGVGISPENQLKLFRANYLKAGFK